MDGKRFSESANASPHAPETQSLEIDPALQDSPHVTTARTRTKRPREREADEMATAEKRVHTVPEIDDLDLEAFMAHLQHHTESNADPPNQSNKNASDASQLETERAIAAQLRDTLSSIQDHDLDDLPLLGPEDEHTEHPTPAAATTQPPGAAPGLPSSLQTGSMPPFTRAKRDDLISQMPPPPPHLSSLPPMPPPPPAFTSPLASHAAIELSRNRSDQRLSTDGASSSVARAVSSRFPEPSFSDIQPVSSALGSQLADQVDKALGDDAEGRTPPQVILHLNENRAICEARKRNILLLDSLACQVLDTLSFSHYQDTLATVMQPESDRGMAYRILLDTFEDLKRVYMKWETKSSRKQAEPKIDEVRPFLTASIPGVEATKDNLTTIQRTNMATFMAAVFGSIEIGFFELNDWFIRVFVTENGRLLKQHCNIYLDLKTQAYISAVENNPDDKDAQRAALDHLFPENLEAQLQEMLADRISLAPSEKELVAKCQRRKENIKSEDPKTLPVKYHWVPFLRDLSEYVSRNHYTLLPQRRHSIVPTEVEAHPPAPVTTSSRGGHTTTRRQAPSRSGTAEPVASSTASIKNSAEKVAKPESPEEQPDQSKKQEVPKSEKTSDEENSNESGGKAEDKADDKSGASSSAGAKPSEDAGDKSHKEDKPDDNAESKEAENQSKSLQKPAQPSIPLEGHPLFPPLPKQVLPRPLPETTLPERERKGRHGPRSHPPPDAAASDVAPGDTLAAYEAARLQAAGTDLIRPKVSLYSTRRTWTKEEEEALLKGMDRVQGPYWAHILELYGPGGKINEVLKDRTQVQLKDKARNLKMFFVRLGLPIPAVFQYVTGDYETRKSSSKRVRDRKLKAESPLPPSNATPQAGPQAGPQTGQSTGQQTSQQATTQPVQRPAQQAGQPQPQQQNESHHSTPQPTQIPAQPSHSGEASASQQSSYSTKDKPDLQSHLEDANEEEDISTLIERMGEYVGDN